MAFRSGFLVVAIGLAASAGAQQTPRELTARELFYSAAATPSRPGAVSQAPAAAKKAAPQRPAPKAAEVARTQPKAPERVRMPANPPAGLPGGGQVIQAAAVARRSAPAPANGQPLGLKYSILKFEGGRSVEVPPDSVFRAGDRIQFSIQTNGPGYLYIVSQGSSGTWKPMFPSPEVESGDNRVDGWRAYTMPPASRIVFDEQTGVEKVFIVFSREPETDLEKLIYSLQGNPKPVSTPSESPRRQMMMVASLNIDNSTVGRLRNAYARDLVIEKVDPGDAGERKEHAVYVVNPTGSSDSHVVADLQLVHK